MVPDVHQIEKAKNRISILLVEDDEPIRKRMGKILAAAEPLELVATAATLEEGRQLCRQHAPAVLITDLKLPDGSGLDLIRETRQIHPATEIMVVSALGDERNVLAAVAAGASGYILKDSASVDLVASVLDLVSGCSPISTSIARTIVRRLQNKPAAAAPPPALTERETDVLWGIAKGLTYNEVSDSLKISRNTVMTHIKNIYRKLEVNSRGEAVFAAINHNIISLGD